MLSSSISSCEAEPTTNAIAFSSIYVMRTALFFLDIFLESFISLFSLDPSHITAAANTGPISEPRPASSTPT